MDKLRILADQTRFNLFKLLIKNDLCVGALATRLNISKAATSQHLQALRKAGFVHGEKRGYYTHYSVDKEAIRSLVLHLMEMINQGPKNGLTCIRALPEENKDQDGEVIRMCCNDCCQQPDQLKGTPQECTPDQIRECHGDTEQHPCTGDKKEEQQ
jgi:DNA-binding transcriptional ArsR family regulator